MFIGHRAKHGHLSFGREDHGDKYKYTCKCKETGYRGFIWLSKKAEVTPTLNLIKTYETWRKEQSGKY